MTRPKVHLAGQTVSLSRDTHEGIYYLNNYAARALVLTDFQRYAATHGQKLHVVSVLPNGIAAVCEDTTGDRSELMRDLHARVAIVRNLDLKRKGHFWDNRKPGDTTLLDRGAVLDRIAEIVCRPVELRLVDRAEQWPGTYGPECWGRTTKVEVGKAKIVVSLEVPKCLEGLPLDEAKALATARIDKLEAKLRRARRGPAKGFKLITRKGCSARKEVTPMSNPCFAAASKGVLDLADKALDTFREDHRIALLAFRARNREVLFPCGTIQMRTLVCAHIAPPSRGDPMNP